MDVKIEPSWGSRLNGEFEAPYFQQLADFVKQEYRQGTCYPPGNQIFNAFNLCPFNAVKVVIIGQDPYHEPGQAEGLCFSVADGVRFPPSLQNVFHYSCNNYRYEKKASQKTAAVLLPPCSIGSFSQISEVLPWLSLPLFFPFVYSTFYFPLATM